MKPHRIVLTMIAIVALSAAGMSQTPSGQALFQQALAKERVEGNLPEAIKLYERVVAEFGSDRALAAQALLQVGLCYEKLGREDAVRAYERIVRDFADQADAGTQARARLAALKGPASGAAAIATTPAVRPLERIDDTNYVLSLSPDGAKAAFIDLDKGQTLSVFDFASRQTTRLANFDLSSYFIFEDAAWSPDGRRIAYTRCPAQMPPGSRCELRAVTLAGESSVIFSSQTLAMRPGGWLPDGSAIVVSAGQLGGAATIGLVPTGGGPFVPLRSITSWTGQYPPAPSVSPDGRLIAFAEGSPGDIHVISRDGRTAHRITDHPANDDRPVWSPDGRHLAFLSDRGGMPALWTVAINDGQAADEAVRVNVPPQDVVGVVGWTTRGLAYLQRQRADDIYTVPVDQASGAPTGSPRLVPYRRTGNNSMPEWSPDGKYLAFVSSSSFAPVGADRRVVLVPSAGGEPREFPVPLQLRWALRWFGNSRGLGITGHNAKSERTLFRLTIDTGELQTFPLRPGVQWNGMYFDWNTDGSRFFYAWQDAEAPTELMIVERDLQSDRERIVYRGKRDDPTDPYGYRGLRFSPDRRALSFRNRSGIHVLDIGSGQARVFYDEVPGEVRSVDPIPEPTSWSPDGRALFARRTDATTKTRDTELRLIPIEGGGGVRRIPFAGELARLLSAKPGAPKPTVDSFVWSPDRSRLAFVLRASRLDALMIENPLALAGAADASARR